MAQKPTLDKVNKILKISKEPVSLEKPVGDEEDSSLGDFIEDTKALAPLEQAIKSNLGEVTIKKFLRKLILLGR